MNVCEMKKGDLPYCVEREKVILGQLLPRDSSCKIWKSGKDASADRHKLQNFPA
jgi:hypothetical protein